MLGLGLCRGEAGVGRFDLRRERREAAVELLALLLEVGQLGLRRLELGVGRFLLLVELGELVGVALLGPGARRQGRRHRRERDRGREEVTGEPPHAQKRRQHASHKQHHPHPVDQPLKRRQRPIARFCIHGRQRVSCLESDTSSPPKPSTQPQMSEPAGERRIGPTGRPLSPQVRHTRRHHAATKERSVLAASESFAVELVDQARVTQRSLSEPKSVKFARTGGVRPPRPASRSACRRGGR